MNPQFYFATTGSLWAMLLAVPSTTAATLVWDANNTGANQTDGAGAWLGTDQWSTGMANTDWTSGDDAVFGNAGAGGSVTLASPTTVNSLTFLYFTGTYNIGTAGQAITLNNGIYRIGGQGGALNINSPLDLPGAQMWTNHSLAAVNVQAATTLSGDLTIDGDGVINSIATAAAIGGSGNIIKNGTGQFNFSAGGTPPTHTFTGDIVVNGGSIGYQNSSVLAGRNVHLTDGYVGGRFGSNFTWTGGLGTGADQIRMTGGTSGFSGEGNSGSSFQVGSSGSTLVWGGIGEGSATGFFNPAILLLNGNHRMNTNGKGTLNNALDLNGADRTVTSTQLTNGANNSGFTVTGSITNSTGTAGLAKTGIGNLILTADNDYNGDTDIVSDNAYSGTSPYLVTAPGSITLSGANGRISNTSALNLTSGGTLRMVSSNGQNTVDRINSAAITVAGGGGIWWENSAGANSFAESVGSATVNSGAFNVNLTTNQTAAGDQTLTLGGLTRNGTASLAFSAGATGPETSGNKNMIVVTGAGTTGAGQIVGPWATSGTAPNSQTDYAVYSGDFVTSLGAGANNDETTWASADNVNFDAATALTANRTVNTLRFSGAANTLDLGSNALETYGLLNGGSGLLTLSGTGSLTTPTGGGQLYVTTGSQVITASTPIVDNGGAVSLVKAGDAAASTDNGNIDSSGTLVLNGVNTYTGDTVINGGTLRIGTNNNANGAKLGGAGGDYAGNILINAGGLLWISTNASQTLSGVISGDGALLKSYNGTLTLSGSNTYTGRTSIAPSTTSGAGVLEVSSFNSVNGGTPLMASSSLGAPTTVSNGTIDLGGPTNVQGGATLRYIGSGETTDRVVNVQLGANTSRIIDASGTGLLKFTSAFTSVGGTYNTTTLQLIGSGDGEISQGLPFAFAALTKNGSGTWTLGGPVESSGKFEISNGTLIATHERALGYAIGNLNTTGPTIQGNGTLSLRNDASVTFGVGGTGYNINNSASGATIDVGRVSGTGSNTLTIGNLTTSSTAGNWQLNFTGANGVSLNAGTLTAPLSTGGTTHTIQNDIATTNGAALIVAGVDVPSTNAAPVLRFNGSGSTTVTGDVTQATVDLAVTKLGSGTVTLGGVNTYIGATSVNEGTLALVGGSQASAITVASGASLGFILGSPTTSTASVDLTNGTVKVTGTPTLASYVLMSASGGFTGTPALDSPIAGYVLEVDGNNLELNSTGALSPYDEWASGFTPDPGLPTENPDGDPLTNLLEFAFGTNPNVSDAVSLVPDGSVNGLPIIQTTAGPGITIDYVFVRRDDHGTSGSLTYTAQFSNELSVWYNSGATPAFVADSTADPDYEVVKIAYPAMLPNGKKARFARLQVNEVP
ncbi:hypothetical protein HAHE_06480 [Haloferula helveola]|uniref:Autotransporter-associated beta strand repeat-containing protein n=1 Tax=Haloferula helveola TaxID=490095 RepID=A0ABN6GZS8_9BACT|nr:hypothetical protein HAHE_06480 [Haloferula helveola]